MFTTTYSDTDYKWLEYQDRKDLYNMYLAIESDEILQSPTKKVSGSPAYQRTVL